jgi:hypothetical protein
MAEVLLYPTLAECIETTARRRYEHLTATILGCGSAPPEVLEEMEVLHAFLATADFRALRAASEREMLGGKTVEFRLSGAGQDFRFTMKTRPT